MAFGGCQTFLFSALGYMYRVPEALYQVHIYISTVPVPGIYQVSQVLQGTWYSKSLSDAPRTSHFL